MSADAPSAVQRSAAPATGVAVQPPRADPTWFGPEDQPLFAWVHQPGDGAARGAVILCQPLARERTAAHSTFRLLAERLAQAGLVAIRFDYEGTGDSAGCDEDPGRVAAWLESVAHAAALARSLGAPSVALVGMRMGALLAATAAPRLGDLAAVVLWDPCRSGRSFVREQRALHALRTTEPRTDGAELPGFVLSAETVADLSRMELAELDGFGAPVLLLERPGRSSSLRRRSAAAASQVDAGEALGQDLLLDVLGLTQEIPEATLARVAAWLVARIEGPANAVHFVPRDAAALTAAGTRVIERFVRLGSYGLFGIEAACGNITGQPAVLMLNAGNEWHAGPNRLWVDLSRRWAPLGFRCVRFDESGLGDSPTRTGGVRHVIRAPEAFDDVADAVAAVSTGDVDDVVLVGICSGAYQALEHGLRGYVRGICAVNPVLHFRPPELSGGDVDPRRRICRPTTGALRAYRRLPLGGLRRLLRAPLWRVVHAAEKRRSPQSWAEELAARGVQVLLLGGVDELRPVLEMVEARGRTRLRVADRFEIEVVPGLDHDLVVAEHRSWVGDRLTDHLERTFLAGTVSSGSPPSRAELVAG
jgi:alpha-beta hydrolase superfamily lysophospholipase